MSDSCAAADVVVIGAGHAGIEAAWAASRLGASVVVCTLSPDTIGQMPCNPAIGGTAKGHLVREIDALGGLMGEAIDATGIQFRLLNRSRGPAVWAPRAQADKRLYAAWVRRRLEARARYHARVRARRGTARRGRRGARRSARGRHGHRGRQVVVTTGTFLDGLIHIGPEQRRAGRYDEPAAVALAASIRALGLPGGRLEDGHAAARPSAFDRLRAPCRSSRATPNRCRCRSSPTGLPQPQICCHTTRTTARVHALVREHIAASPLYNGQITGIGPTVLPLAGRQGHALPGQGGASAVPRARGPGRRRDLHQRLLDEFAGGRAAGDRAGAAGPGCGRADPARLCGRVRLRPADGAAPLAGGEVSCRASISRVRSTARPATRRRQPKAGSRARTPACGRLGRAPVVLGGTRATSVSWSTTWSRGGVWSRTGCSRRAPSTGCGCVSTTPTCDSRPSVAPSARLRRALGALRGPARAIRAQHRSVLETTLVGCRLATACPRPRHFAIRPSGCATCSSREPALGLELDPLTPSLDVASLDADCRYAGYLRREDREVARAARYAAQRRAGVVLVPRTCQACRESCSSA